MREDNEGRKIKRLGNVEVIAVRGKRRSSRREKKESGNDGGKEEKVTEKKVCGIKMVKVKDFHINMKREGC